MGWGWGVVGQADKGLTFRSLKMFDIDTSECFLVLWVMFNTFCTHSEKHIAKMNKLQPNVAFLYTSNII